MRSRALRTAGLTAALVAAWPGGRRVTADPGPATTAASAPPAPPLPMGTAGDLDWHVASAVDAAADSGPFLPTAVTLERGQLSFSSYDLGLLAASYGVTDRLEVTLIGTPPIHGTVVVAADVKLGWALAGGRLRIAALAVPLLVHGVSSLGTLAGVAPGVATDLCLAGACRWQVGATLLGILANDTLAGQVVPFYAGVRGFYRPFRHVAFLAELDDQGAGGAVPNNGLALDAFEEPSLAAGLRIFGRHWAGGIEALVLLGRAPSGSRALPWLTLTYRP